MCGWSRNLVIASKLSIDYLRNSDEALTLIKKLATKLKRRDDKSRDVAEAIPTEYLEGKAEVIDQVNLREVYNSFVASASIFSLLS